MLQIFKVIPLRVRSCVRACVSVSVKHAGNFRHLSKDKRPKRGRFSFVWFESFCRLLFLPEKKKQSHSSERSTPYFVGAFLRTAVNSAPTQTFEHGFDGCQMDDRKRRVEHNSSSRSLPDVFATFFFSFFVLPRDISTTHYSNQIIDRSCTACAPAHNQCTSVQTASWNAWTSATLAFLNLLHQDNKVSSKTVSCDRSKEEKKTLCGAWSYWSRTLKRFVLLLVAAKLVREI